MYRLIPILFFAACKIETVIPTCDFINATRSGDRISIKIESDAYKITMCRQYPKRIECTDIMPNYYECISIRGEVGDVVTFIDESNQCELIIK